MNLQRANDILRRARAATRLEIRYGLGQGGFFPRDPQPSRNGRLDCSGFVSWCIGISRYQGDKDKPHSTFVPWIETTAIWYDARGRQSLFKVLDAPVPGCLIVYPDSRFLGRRTEGHVGIVSEVKGGKVTKVIHCSVGNDRRGSAVRETDARMFANRQTIYCALKQDV